MYIKSLVSLAMLTALPVWGAAEVAPAGAGVSQSKLLETSTMAIPLKRKEPRYPRRAAGKGQEGWVELSYVVEPDGSVSNVIIEDSSGQRDFERTALKSVKRWTFEPATVNGEPVQQCNSSVRLDFTLGGKRQGARGSFVKRYHEVRQLIVDDQFSEAEEALNALKERPKWNLYEDAWYWMAKAHYYMETGDEQRQLSSLMKAAGSSGRYLDDELYGTVLTQIFVLQYQQHHYQAALETYDKLTSNEYSRQQAAEWQVYQQKIEAILAGPEHIGVYGEITDKSHWLYRLSRREFAFVDVNGQLDKLDIRCDRKRHVYSFNPDNAWKLPESWGSCWVFVYGEPKSNFTLVQLADSPVSG